MLSLDGEQDVERPIDTVHSDQAGGASTGVVSPKGLVRDLQRYREPRMRRSAWELAITAVPFFLLLGATLFVVSKGQLLGLLLTIPTGLFLLRLFLIQHDCGHGAFLPGRAANDWIGRALGALTFTPYDCWKRSHALHHASTGNLAKRGFGDIDTLTVREYRASTPRGRLMYRLYRHPLVLFGLGPAYMFFVRHRLPAGMKDGGRSYWLSAIGSNVATAAFVAALAYIFGLGTVAMVLAPVVLIAASVGMWLFYIQHQFEESHWDDEADWSFHVAALHGSSHLDLPPVLRWFTANIGVHHVHHLVSRIPFYRLPEVLRAYPSLAGINRLTIRDTFQTLRLALWDEGERRMVSFAAVSKSVRAHRFSQAVGVPRPSELA